jgi:RNA processing factor Prp31
MSEESVLKKLEQRITDLETKVGEKKKAVRPPREPSEYNKFMGEYMAKNKSDKKSHKDLFAESVKAWNVKKGK